MAIFTSVVAVTFLLVVLAKKVSLGKLADEEHEKLGQRRQEINRKDEQLQIRCVDELLNGSSLAEAGQRLCTARQDLLPENTVSPQGHWNEKNLKQVMEDKTKTINQKFGQSLRLFVAAALAVTVLLATIGNLIGYQYLSSQNSNVQGSDMDFVPESNSVTSANEWIMPDTETTPPAVSSGEPNSSKTGVTK
ncbi:MAG: hypothetical protein AAFN77_18115 [Planctomycetota bacterium]